MMDYRNIPQVIHGRYDILAAPKHAEALAKKMCCRLVMLEGAHFITRECGTELNSLLRAIIFPAQVLSQPRCWCWCYETASCCPADLRLQDAEACAVPGSRSLENMSRHTDSCAWLLCAAEP